MKQNEFKETEIGLIPEDWEVETIGDSSVDIIDGDRGVNYPKKTEFEKEGFCLFLNTKNVPGERFELSESVFIDKQKDEILRKGKLQRGDLVLTTRGSLGNVAYYNDIVPYEHVRINSGMVIVRDSEKTFDTYFLYLLLRSPLLKRQYFGFATGSAQPQLPIRDIKKIKLPVPPLAEQKAIAKILSDLDSKIEFNNKMNKTLEAIGQALFKHWFVDFDFPNEEGKPYKSSGGEMVESELGEIPREWRITKLGDFFPVKTGKKDANISSDNGKYPFFTCAQNILHCNNYSFDESALLLAGNGDFNIKWYRGKFEAYQRTYVLVPYDKELLGFLYYLMKKNLNDITRGHRGSVINFITKGMIENFKVIVPPFNKIRAMATMFNSINRKINSLKKESNPLSQIRDSLLPRLMSGRIRVGINL